MPQEAGWKGAAVNFFDRAAEAAAASRPEPTRPPPRPVWMMPEGVLPAVVPAELMLAHTDRAAIAVTALRAYPNGFSFTLSAVLREQDEQGEIFGPGVRHRLGRHTGAPPDEFLRVGVQFADGTTVTNLHWPPFDREPEGRVLCGGSGSSDNRRSDMDYWVWPAPPPGPVVFVCQWPALDIPESRAEIDARSILDAAPRAIELWP